MKEEIAGKIVDLTKKEYEYFLELEGLYGKEIFSGLLSVDDEGKIVEITPSLTEPTPLGIIFFCLQTQLSQRLRLLDKVLKTHDQLAKRVTRLERSKRKMKLKDRVVVKDFSINEIDMSGVESCENFLPKKWGNRFEHM